MTTKIKPTDHGTFIVYEANDSDEMEYEEFDSWEEANEWKKSMDDIMDYYDVDTDDINDAVYG